MLSVIIPTCNRNDTLRQCLLQLQPALQELTMNDYEVIVTDDSAQNAAMVLVQSEFEWARWVEGKKMGPAANRNNGALCAKGDWLIFIDDDCIPARNILKVYSDAINSFKETKVFEGFIGAEREKKSFDEEAPINTTGGNLWSCNFAVDKKLFFDVGGFDESFPYAAMEDIDFRIRVEKYATMIFLKDACVIHPWRQLKPFSQFKKHLISHINFRKKYKGSIYKSRIKIFLGCIYFDFKELLKFSFRGWPAYIERCMLNFCLIFI